ncbi:MAG: type II toxin-antitoxin system RelE/ParE family toxin [Brachybacterium sp.]|nr:type II toxin-antitoxin system RelE/ParE family toxin [Brachybacterium sp.]
MGPLEGTYSARRGEYRIIHTIDDSAVVIPVLTISHRRDADRPRGPGRR